MDIIDDPVQYQQQALAWRGEGLTHGFVPTMGALHAGHFRLVEEARRRVDRVSVSLFVNPRQFGPGEDLDKYPRAFERDAEGCRTRGVDVLFAPTPAAMYPEGFQSHVTVERLTAPLCGAARPGHFQGVTTVVMKLFMLAQPSVAFFGWKDAQQFLVLRRMVTDLAIPVEMVGVETVREADGLAMSSRNAYLSPEERAAAPLIYRGLSAARAAFAAGERNTAVLTGLVRQAIESSPLFQLEYADCRSLSELEPLTVSEPGNTLLAVAARLGTTRLIDNIRL
ncbi:MAG: pantoate--beta-alanine ligase [bacterium]|nr:pantoate--beta-alanine ligase [bacterium]